MLIALDDYRNIHRAADALRMTQPAASKQLKDLEDLLDVKLFEPLPRGMEQTPFGETMIRHARTAIGTLSSTQEDIAALKAGLTGQVDIGAIVTPALNLLPGAIAAVKQKARLLRIGVPVEHSDILLEKLQHSELDFMIGRILEKADSGNLACKQGIEEPCVAVARVGHPLMKRKHLQLKDLLDYPWILPPHGSVLRHRFDMMLINAGLTPPVNVVDATNLILTSSPLPQTDSLNVVPLPIAEHYVQLKRMSVVPCVSPLPCKMDAFSIITRKDCLLSACGRLLLEAVQDAIAATAPDL